MAGVSENLPAWRQSPIPVVIIRETGEIQEIQKKRPCLMAGFWISPKFPR